MSAPFRRVFDEEKAIDAIHETMDAWRNNQRKGLFNYSIFSHTNAAVSKEDAPCDDVNAERPSRRPSSKDA